MNCVMAVMAAEVYLVNENVGDGLGWMVDLRNGTVNGVLVDQATRMGQWTDPGSAVSDITMSRIERAVRTYEEGRPNASRP